MSGTQFRKLLADVEANGLKDKTINYVEVGSNKYIVSGNNRALAATMTGRAGDLNFQRVDLPFRGFKTEEDVINAHADALSGVR